MRYAMSAFVLSSALAGTAGAAPAEIPEAPPPVVQPGIPGQWSLTPAQPLPPLSDIVAAPSPGRLIYGLYAWGGEYHTHRAAIQDIGWAALRIAGPFDDALMQALAEDGVQTMVTLENRLLDAAKGMDRTAFATDEEFVETCRTRMVGFLDRYGPGGAFFTEHPGVAVRPIEEVEIWNEPNFQYLIPPDGRPQEELEAAREQLYVKLLRGVYPALKAKHPQVTIAGMAGGGMSAGDLRFVDHVHASSAELTGFYDVLSTHPYVRPAPPEANALESWGSYSIARSVDYLRRAIASHGAVDRPVWITEIGWPISQADGGRYPAPATQSFATPLLQAAYICRTYALALRLGVSRVHVMFTTDTDHFNAGFFERDGRWRPSAHAVKTMIQQMPDPHLSGALSDGAEGYYAYTFTSPGQNPVIMAWNVAGPRAAQIPVPTEQVRVTDMFGHQTEKAAAKGLVTLTVGPCPVYLSW